MWRKEEVPSGRQVDNADSAKTRFDSLFNSHHDTVYRYCVRRLGPADADDAAADVFAVAWRRMEDIPSGDLARAWLIGVAYKVVGNKYRARRRQMGLWARLMNATDNRSDPYESGFDRDADIQRLHAALGGLSAHDQELLRLSAWDGLSRIEIAHALGVKENAVDQRLHRARARLKERLDRLDGNATHPKEART